MSVEFSWPIYGHDQQIKFLHQSLQQSRLNHSYLFYGPPGLGKKLMAEYFAKSLFCQDPIKRPCARCQPCRMMHKGSFPDLYILGKEISELSAESVKEFLAKLSLTSAMGGHKLAIIENAAIINLFAANALLKTLEELPKNTTIILVADHIRNLPATVISRCQLLKFRSLKKEEMNEWLSNFDFPKDAKETIANLSFGKPGLALKFINDKLAGFKNNSDFIIKLLSNNTLTGLQSLDNWFATLKKEYPHYKIYELGELTERHLDILELFLRDILWMKLGRPPVNILYQDELNKLAGQYNSPVLLKNLLAIDKIKYKLKHNVSPQLLWENLILDFKV